MKYEIEKGIPIPRKLHESLAPIKEIIKEINVDESFFVPMIAGESKFELDKRRNAAINLIRLYIYSSGTNMKFESRTFENGFRIWRVK